MRSLQRVIDQAIKTALQQFADVTDHLHLARAYRPVSQNMLPRWRNLGTAILPYHYMRPVLVPVQQPDNRKPR